MIVEILFDKNNMLLRLSGAKDAKTATFLNAAMVTARLVDGLGVDIVGQTWPLTLDFVAGSNGDYCGVLNDTLVQVIGAIERAQVTFDGGVGLKAFWETPCTVQVREE